MTVTGTLAADMARSGLRPFIERAEKSSDLSADDVRELLENCLFAFTLLDRGVGQFRRSVDEGIELGRLQEIVGDLPDLASECRRAFRRVGAQAERLRLDAEVIAALGPAE